jgi:Na+/melibiose symporter-like transporter
MAQLLASVPTGVAIDGYCRRDFALRSAAALGILAVIVACISSVNSSFIGMAVALALWGLFWGIANTAVGALLADSTTSGGHRTKIFIRRKMIESVGTTVGPIISCIMFAVLGNQWSIKNCAAVVIIGQFVCVPAIALLCTFRDNDFFHEDDQSDDDDDDVDVDLSQDIMEEGLVTKVKKRSLSRKKDEYEACEVDDLSDTCTESGSSGEESEEETEKVDQVEDKVKCISSDRVVSICVAISDLMTGLASGMSISYFPVFFSYYLDLSPTVVQILYIIHPLGQTVLGPFAQSLSHRYSRCQVAVAFKWFGVSMMFALIATYHYNVSRWIICLLYVLRSTFMNSTQPLTKSILFDSIPRDERGKWTALESVNTSAWSGSALIGAFLVREHGILLNFILTGSLQFLATLPLLFVVWKQRNSG